MIPDRDATETAFIVESGESFLLRGSGDYATKRDMGLRSHTFIQKGIFFDGLIKTLDFIIDFLLGSGGVQKFSGLTIFPLKSIALSVGSQAFKLLGESCPRPKKLCT